VSQPRELLYWDPLPHVAVVFAAQPRDGLWTGPDATFQGKWEERNWRNVPGPFYGAMTDNCWVGRLHAPRHVLYGGDIDYEQEFLYRQPGNLQELDRVPPVVAELTTNSDSYCLSGPHADGIADGAIGRPSVGVVAETGGAAADQAALFSVAQAQMAASGSCSVLPRAVSAYSTCCGGVSLSTRRCTNPSRSMSRSVSVRTF
jgi:hypothetical protein